MNDRDYARSMVNLIVASALVAGIGFIILMMFHSLAQGEQRRASSTVYTQGANAAPTYRKSRKYRYTYRRHRSRAAAVTRAAAPVSQPASRGEIPSPGVHEPSRPWVSLAGQSLLMGGWSAHYFFEPYYGPAHSAHAENAEFSGPIMLERGDPEPPEPSNLHLWALGAIAAAFCAGLYYAVVGGRHAQFKDPRPWQPPQWTDGPDA